MHVISGLSKHMVSADKRTASGVRGNKDKMDTFCGLSVNRDNFQGMRTL